MLQNFLLVGIGGAAGSILRYGTSLLIHSKAFPLATFTVNIIGSAAIGMLLALGLRAQPLAAQWKLLLATGLCGGFTTFSAFSAENLQLLLEGKIAASLGYTAISLVAGIAAVWAGFKLFQS